MTNEREFMWSAVRFIAKERRRGWSRIIFHDRLQLNLGMTLISVELLESVVESRLLFTLYSADVSSQPSSSEPGKVKHPNCFYPRVAHQPRGCFDKVGWAVSLPSRVIVLLVLETPVAWNSSGTNNLSNLASLFHALMKAVTLKRQPNIVWIAILASQLKQCYW